MKAFLLAAGHGTRLRPLTDKTPKCLLPIRGEPMLQIWLDLCRRFGIAEILINIHAHAGMVRDFVRTRVTGSKVRVIEEVELLGSAGTLLANREWVESDEYFWVFYADVLHQVDLSAMLALHRSRSVAATLGVYRVPDPHRCGIVELDDDGVIHGFVEKPANPRSNLAFAGLMIGTPALLNAIPSKKPADMGFDVLPRLTGNMLAYPIDDYLIDIGTTENYKKAQLTWPGFEGELSSLHAARNRV
jgi:mannose-1-phosphate guanylyltransferase